MAFSAFLLLATALAVLQASIVFGQTSTTSQPMTTSAHFTDPFAGGKSGNPGARIHLSNKTIAEVHAYAVKIMASALESINLADFTINVGGGELLIKPPRITEVKVGSTDFQLAPPNRILSRFYNGQMTAKGVWQYKKQGKNPIGGVYRATILKGELNGTTQFGRAYDGKPTAQMVDCKADLSQHRVEIEGAEKLKLIENCNVEMATCVKIRNYFEDALCGVLKSFVKNIINLELQKFPTQMPIHCELHKTDYSLLSNEPKVTTYDIQAGLEGKYVWRGSSNVPFYPNPLTWVDRKRMVSFEMGDYTFNTLLHQAHLSGYKYSAARLSSQSMQQLLRLNCDAQTTVSTTPSTRKGYRAQSPAKITLRRPGFECLGQLFENFTSFGPYSANDTGDIVYRCSQKPKAVFLQSDKSGFFDGSNGTLEMFGPVDQWGNRKSLAKADVRVLRGDFTPKLNGVNITASIKISQFRLAQASIQSRKITDDWLDQLAQFAAPIVMESINDFFKTYAQFSMPLPDSFVCASPEFLVSSRTMQIDCDVKKSGRSKWVCVWVNQGWVCGH